jgi:hypothetical protein
LAHLGPKFRDPGPVNPTLLAHSRRRDIALLHEIGDGLKMPGRTSPPDPDGYFRIIAEENDARRICGLPPTYTILQALRPRRGELLHYNQYVHPDGFESVSFASAVFYT